MSYTIVFRSKARKQFLALPVDVRDRLEAALLALAENPYAGNVKRLRGKLKPHRRLCVGDYRMIFIQDDRSHTVEVIAVAPRGAAY